MSLSAPSNSWEGDNSPGHYCASRVVQLISSQSIMTTPSTPTQCSISNNTPPQAPRHTSSRGSTPPSTSQLTRAFYYLPGLHEALMLTSPWTIVHIFLQDSRQDTRPYLWSTYRGYPLLSLQIVRAKGGRNPLQVMTVHRA